MARDHGDEQIRVGLRILGRVQGVYYRASAEVQASRLGLTGYVRNEADGSVWAVAEGPRDQVERFIAWCRQGPQAAHVEFVEVEWGEPTGEFDDFEVR